MWPLNIHMLLQQTCYSWPKVSIGTISPYRIGPLHTATPLQCIHPQAHQWCCRSWCISLPKKDIFNFVLVKISHKVFIIVWLKNIVFSEITYLLLQIFDNLNFKAQPTPKKKCLQNMNKTFEIVEKKRTALLTLPFIPKELKL